ncbi:hypothetical protein B0J12DRAFT_719045 [Macrophomina phaseolina]|uniref:Uncharacterized protein n=1 Tax=Macrophomina phaseolina TaxID=35725 RepID=A0ABQ8GAL7_9PEZI|nr:hypothetical protein B0J12DRAFT_719045 [Macrophomina phaseolina]
MLEDTKTLRNIFVAWTLCFNDVLDANKLHASLSSLLEIGDWRKVGGRLRLKDTGELEIHVPRPFTAERPAVSYTHQALPMDIGDHPLAKTLPKATEGPSIQPGPQGFPAFAAREDAPSTLQDFTSQDTPQLSLRITSFNDSTLSEVPPMLGAREDAICAAADALMEKEEAFRLGQKQLRGLAMLKFGLRFAWDLLWNPVAETHTIFLPEKAVAEAIWPSKEQCFISEGDVLTAWAMRAPRPATALHAINARFRLSSLLQAPGVPVQNMAVAAFTFLSPEVATGPLGPIALESRRCLTDQSTEAQVLAFLRELRRESKSGSDPASVCGEPDALLMPFTSWTRAGLFKAVDFGPALVRAGETGQSRSGPPGTVVFHHAQSLRESPTARNAIEVLGKDHGNNYWLTGTLLPLAWAKIEENLNRM